jgi:phage terminase Nu1 subunit (DNA packaging protein)
MKTAALAHVLDLTPRRLQQLTRENVIPAPIKGQYELAPAVRAYVRYLRNGQRNVRDDELRREQTREAKERANKLELENQKMMARVIDLDVARDFCQGFGVVLRRQILASSLDDLDKDEMLAGIKKLLDEQTITKSLTNEN